MAHRRAIVVGIVLFAAAGANSALAQPSGFWVDQGYPGEKLLGPDRAKGAVLYLHGTGRGDSFGSPPPPYARLLQRDGWDIMRHNRRSTVDTHYDSAQSVLAESRKLRALGYARVALAGQSRGAWPAVMAASQAPDIYAVVATAPGGYGDGDIGEIGRSAQQLYDMLGDIASTRVMLFFFAGDRRENVPGGRGEPSRQALSRRGVPQLVIDRPPEFRGHFGGTSGLFARRYGECIVAFVDAATPPAVCDLSQGLAIGADLPLPADLRILPVPTAVPRERAAFAGKWYGEYASGEARLLAVTEIDADEVRAVYAYAPAPQQVQTARGWRKIAGKFVDGALVFTESRGTLTYLMRADGRLDGTFRAANGKEVLKTIVRRVE
ncbi:MAG: hypothetical protein HY246_08735 [Proteobacteria bacterium]|nr:hypothetical protein [Pseudomonadota bacterium]